MSELYPMMLYREGGSERAFDKDCTTRIVSDEDEERAARGEGFRRSLTDAQDAAPDGDDLREELEQMRLRAEAAEAERDELRELLAAFDGDKDGKPGGSRKAKAVQTEG